MSKYAYGNRVDLPDQRDYSYSPETTGTLPESVDLRNGLPPVYDQGNLGSCTANAGAAAFDFDRLKEGKPFITPSRLFLYYNERWMDGTIASDTGASIRDIIKATKKYGVCPESDWPYDVAKFADTPPANCFKEAVTNELLTYARVSRKHFQHVLAAGNVFVAGITVYESFESDGAAKTGVIPMPAASEAVLGGHAIVICGYKQLDGKLYYMFRNSWGATWGDGGYGYLPAEYLAGKQLSSDFWVLLTVEA